ncbi:hypothetical protein B0H13DRAFT_2387089 [Mycena leptocephala]|nr:hypothetical protein B0H13DRAFT_2387089 [Mycena leptocephala]
MAEGEDEKTPPALERSDILAWLLHCTLDIIGQACALTSPLSFIFPPHRDSRRAPLSSFTLRGALDEMMHHC